MAYKIFNKVLIFDEETTIEDLLLFYGVNEEYNDVDLSACKKIKTLKGKEDIFSLIFNNLNKLILPNELESIPENCFFQLQIDEVIVGTKTKTLENGASRDCFINKITLNNQLEEIGEEAFYQLKTLSLIIPKSVKKIARNAFMGSIIFNLEINADGLIEFDDSKINLEYLIVNKDNIKTSYDLSEISNFQINLEIINDDKRLAFYEHWSTLFYKEYNYRLNQSVLDAVYEHFGEEVPSYILTLIDIFMFKNEKKYFDCILNVADIFGVHENSKEDISILEEIKAHILANKNMTNIYNIIKDISENTEIDFTIKQNRNNLYKIIDSINEGVVWETKHIYAFLRCDNYNQGRILIKLDQRNAKKKEIVDILSEYFGIHLLQDIDKLSLSELKKIIVQSDPICFRKAMNDETHNRKIRNFEIEREHDEWLRKLLSKEYKAKEYDAQKYEMGFASYIEYAKYNKGYYPFSSIYKKYDVWAKNILSDLIFGDTFENVNIHYKVLKNFMAQIDNEQNLKKIFDRHQHEKLFANVLDVLEKIINLEELLKNDAFVLEDYMTIDSKKIQSDLYDCFQIARYTTAKNITDNLTDITAFSCREIDGVKVYYQDGEKFNMLIRNCSYERNKKNGIIVDSSDQDRALDSISTSLINDKFAYTYGDSKEFLTFGYFNVDPKTIIEVCAQDSMIGFYIGEGKSTSSAEYFGDMKNIIDESSKNNRYNEINILSPLRGMEEYYGSKNKIQRVKPDCIICATTPTSYELELAKKFELPIFYANTTSFEKKDFATDDVYNH